MADRKPTNYEAEILAAMAQARYNMENYGHKVPGGSKYESPAAQGSTPEEERYLRARAALAAQQSAQENETVPEGGMRYTDPLDRSYYPGS
jgi:hypothetical protein